MSFSHNAKKCQQVKRTKIERTNQKQHHVSILCKETRNLMARTIYNHTSDTTRTNLQKSAY